MVIDYGTPSNDFNSRWISTLECIARLELPPPVVENSSGQPVTSTSQPATSLSAAPAAADADIISAATTDTTDSNDTYDSIDTTDDTDYSNLVCTSSQPSVANNPGSADSVTDNNDEESFEDSVYESIEFTSPTGAVYSKTNSNHWWPFSFGIL